MTEATAGHPPSDDPAPQAQMSNQMPETKDVLDGTPLMLPAIRQVDRGAPWQWLAKGWEDFLSAWQISAALGAVYVALGGAILWALLLTDAFYLAAPLAGGFFLVGPVAAVGFYEVSRARAAGETPTMAGAFSAWKRNPTQVLFMAVVLLVIYVIWARIAILVFMLFFSGSPPRPEVMFIVDVFLSAQSIPFLTTGTIIGAVLAAIVFSLSAISIPLLVDRPNSNVIVAMAASVEAVRHNAWAMGIWAWLIVLFIGAGLAAGFVGLLVTLPLIGHATWHAYNSLVDFSDVDAPKMPETAAHADGSGADTTAPADPSDPSPAPSPAPAPAAPGNRYVPPIEAVD